MTQDADTTRIEIQLDRYLPAGAGRQEQVNVRKQVAWRALRWDAQHHSNVAAIRNLSAAADELRAVMDDPRLSPVE